MPGSGTFFIAMCKKDWIDGCSLPLHSSASTQVGGCNRNSRFSNRHNLSTGDEHNNSSPLFFILLNTVFIPSPSESSADKPNFTIMLSQYLPFGAPLLFKGSWLLLFFNGVWERRTPHSSFTLSFPPLGTWFKVKLYHVEVKVWGCRNYLTSLERGTSSFAYHIHPFSL